MSKAGAQPLFGVAPIDRLLGAPPAGATVLLRNDARIDGTPLLLQATGNALANGTTVLYVVTARRPSRVIQGLRSMGFSNHKNLLFFDAHSGTFNLGEPSEYRLHGEPSWASFLATLARAAIAYPKALLVMDSLGNLADRIGGTAMEEGLDAYLGVASRFHRSLTAVTRWPQGNAQEMTGRFDAAIDLLGVGVPIARHSALAIAHSKWQTKTDSRPRLYEVEHGAGVCVHIPKIAIIGPGDAGKTSFVHAISPTAKSTERLGTTVALDRGQYNGNGIVAELFGTPGQPRFDALLEPLLDQAVGAVLLIHSIKKADLQRAHEVLARVRSRGIQIVVAVTHQDKASAPSPADVRRAFPEISDLPILSCNATESKSATQVLETLIESIQGGIAA